MSTGLEVREVRRLPESPGVIALIEEHARYESGTRAQDPGYPGRLQECLDSGRLVMFVAVDESRYLGYATLTFDVATWTGRMFGHMDCLFVRDGERGAGVGRLLVDRLAERAVEAGAVELQWQTPEWNVRAARFYDRLGASRAGKLRYTWRLPAPGAS
ncbi:GNAT family N-acetyltransferase [Myceligenerans crystallogenes]|uniref:N-acetyltransferase domain-containing protein n=1 Tax=Myceligenerans crystallogenes TaxID=316335 RepID=A0ABN2NBQ7_9MICO